MKHISSHNGLHAGDPGTAGKVVTNKPARSMFVAQQIILLQTHYYYHQARPLPFSCSPRPQGSQKKLHSDTWRPFHP